MIILYFWTDKGHDTPQKKKKKGHDTNQIQIYEVHGYIHNFTLTALQQLISGHAFLFIEVVSYYIYVTKSMQ